MRYEGVRDGIEYFALATTGGHLSREIAGAGFLHHFNVVTVRRDKVSIAADGREGPDAITQIDPTHGTRVRRGLCLRGRAHGPR